MSSRNFDPLNPDTIFQKFNDSFNYMQGQLLTVIDASFSDLTQRDAAKSLIKTILWESRRKMEMYVSDQSVGSGETRNPPQDLSGSH